MVYHVLVLGLRGDLAFQTEAAELGAPEVPVRRLHRWGFPRIVPFMGFPSCAIIFVVGVFLFL